MKEKVTLRELVGNTVIYAMLIAVYYWMWARRDWKDYYLTIQYIVGAFTAVFLFIQASRIKKYNKESIDELAKQNLDRVNGVCLKLLTVLMVIIAFAGAMELFNHIIMGYAIVFSLLGISIIRTILFYLMDVKGV